MTRLYYGDRLNVGVRKEEAKNKEETEEKKEDNNFLNAHLHNWIDDVRHRKDTLITLRFCFNHDDDKTTCGVDRDSSDVRPRIPRSSPSSFLRDIIQEESASHLSSIFLVVRSSASNVPRVVSNKLNDTIRLMIASTRSAPLPNHPNVSSARKL